MHYVKSFEINGVETKQVACIELRGKPNAATEGAIGVLGIDVTSPTRDVYKCVAVNGAIYTWELLSSGLSIISAKISGKGTKSVQFLYSNLRIPSFYVIKIGDLILDKEGYLYQIASLYSTYCVATYCDSRIVSDKSAYAYAQEGGYTGTEAEFIAKLAMEYDPAKGTIDQRFSRTLQIVSFDAENGELVTVSEDSDLAKYVSFVGATGRVLYVMLVLSGEDCEDPVTKGYIATPTKDSIAGYDYTYSGWSLTEGDVASSTALVNITENRTVYAVFTESENDIPGDTPSEDNTTAEIIDNVLYLRGDSTAEIIDNVLYLRGNSKAEIKDNVLYLE